MLYFSELKNPVFEGVFSAALQIGQSTSITLIAFVEGKVFSVDKKTKSFN